MVEEHCQQMPWSLGEVDEVAARMENQLTFVGITAVEDRLQDITQNQHFSDLSTPALLTLTMMWQRHGKKGVTSILDGGLCSCGILWMK